MAFQLLFVTKEALQKLPIFIASTIRRSLLSYVMVPIIPPSFPSNADLNIVRHRFTQTTRVLLLPERDRALRRRVQKGAKIGIILSGNKSVVCW